LLERVLHWYDTLGMLFDCLVYSYSSHQNIAKPVYSDINICIRCAVWLLQSLLTIEIFLFSSIAMNCKVTFSLNIISYNIYCILIKMFLILDVYKYRITYHNDTIHSLHESNSNWIYSSIVIDCCVYPFCNCSCELGF